MIYVTGDTHGDWIQRFKTDSFPDQKLLTKEDYVIVCGDFGLWHDNKEERYKLKWLDEKPFTTLFVDGNHENFDRLYDYPIEKWHGGRIHRICPSVIHLMRGQVFELDGKRIFTFGGAASHDIQNGILEIGDSRIKSWQNDYTKMFRVNHVSWWEQELPSDKEMKEGIQNLGQHNNAVDFIITHSPSTSMLRLLDKPPTLYNTNVLNHYLQKIQDIVSYKAWFFGHMHVDDYLASESSMCMYKKIIRIK